MTGYRTCPFREATCGLALDVREGALERDRGDADDTGTAELEPLSGNAILNGVPVAVEPVESLVVSR
jgi:hypothetical protein